MHDNRKNLIAVEFKIPDTRANNPGEFAAF